MSQTIPAIHIGLMSLKEGQIVGERYQLDRLIAQGGFGAVWRAKDLESGREVAVKFPRPASCGCFPSIPTSSSF